MHAHTIIVTATDLVKSEVCCYSTLPYFTISQQPKVGQGEKCLHDIFRQALQQQPCVIIIDEAEQYFPIDGGVANVGSCGVDSFRALFHAALALAW
jgi:hypothetical protein